MRTKPATLVLIVSTKQAPSPNLRTELVGKSSDQRALRIAYRPLATDTAWDIYCALERLPQEELESCILVVDGALTESKRHEWDARQPVGDWPGILPNLIALYPEVYFVIFRASEKFDGNVASRGSGVTFSSRFPSHFVSSVDDLWNLIERHSRGERFLFDPEGLRSFIVSEYIGDMSRPNRFSPFIRSRGDYVAAIVEEEKSFLMLNGLAAYKAGARAQLIGSKVAFDELRGQESYWRGASRAKGRFLITDWDLTFEDHDPSDPTPTQEGTAGECEKLRGLFCPFERKGVQHDRGNVFVVLVSSAGESDEPPSKFARDHSAARRTKPYAGLFDLLCASDTDPAPNPLASLWEENLAKCLTSDASAAKEAQSSAGIAASSSEGEGGGLSGGNEEIPHSAPFVSAQLAESLISRARIRLATADDTSGFVHAALLACTAKEILGGLSRTLSYEAVALQNEAEVQAEIGFYGTSQVVRMQERLEAISWEVSAIAGLPAGAPVRDRGALNCRLQLVNNLRRILAEREQVEAAEVAAREFARCQLEVERLDTIWSLSWFSGRRSVEKAKRVWGESLTAAWKDHRFVALRTRLAERQAAIMRSQILVALRLGGRSARWIGLRYVDGVTSTGTSISRLVMSSTAWVVVFGLLYGAQLSGEWTEGLGHAAFTMLSMQPGVQSTHEALGNVGGYTLLLIAELSIAYVHLGLLISVLYRQVTKRAP